MKHQKRKGGFALLWLLANLAVKGSTLIVLLRIYHQ